MKQILALLMAAGLVGSAEDPNVPVAKSYLDKLSVSPFGAVRHINITDGPVYGAGLDIGVPINKAVSLHVANMGYSTDDWRGSAIDETSVLFKADLVRYSSERLKLYALGGGDRSWDMHDWAFGVGLGVSISLGKNVSVGVDSRIRSWFNTEEDLITRGLLNISF